MRLIIALSITMATMVAQCQFVSLIVFMSLPWSNYAGLDEDIVSATSPTQSIAVSPAQRTSLSRPSRTSRADSSGRITAARPTRSVSQLVLPRIASAAANPSAWSECLPPFHHFVFRGNTTLAPFDIGASRPTLALVSGRLFRHDSHGSSRPLGRSAQLPRIIASAAAIPRPGLINRYRFIVLFCAATQLWLP